MDTHDMLVELLAIKLFEHSLLIGSSSERHGMSWYEALPEDRQDARTRIITAANAEELYT